MSFKDEIKTYIRLAMNDSQTKTVQDVVDILKMYMAWISDGKARQLAMLCHTI